MTHSTVLTAMASKQNFEADYSAVPTELNLVSCFVLDQMSFLNTRLITYVTLETRIAIGSSWVYLALSVAWISQWFQNLKRCPRIQYTSWTKPISGPSSATQIFAWILQTTAMIKLMESIVFGPMSLMKLFCSVLTRIDLILTCLTTLQWNTLSHWVCQRRASFSSLWTWFLLFELVFTLRALRKVLILLTYVYNF